MNKIHLSLLEKRLGLEGNLSTRDLALSKQKTLNIKNKISSLEGEYKQIKKNIEQIKFTHKGDVKALFSFIKPAAEEMQLKKTEISELKVELGLQKQAFWEAQQALEKNNIKKEKVGELKSGIESLEEMLDEEQGIEELAVFNYLQNSESLQSSFSAVEARVQSAELERISTNDTLGVEALPSVHLSGDTGYGQNEKLRLISDIKAYSDSYSKNLSFSYSITENSQIKFNLITNQAGQISVVIIPELLKHRLAIWSDSSRIQKAFAAAGIQLRSLKIYAGGRRNG